MADCFRDDPSKAAMRRRGRTAGLAAILLIPCAPISALAKDAAPLAIIATIPGGDGGWDYASVDPLTRRLYVAREDGVMAVNLDKGDVNPHLLAGQRVHAIVPLQGGQALSTNGASDTAVLFSAETGEISATIATGKGPDAAVFDPASGLVLVMDHAGGDVTLIDPRAKQAVGRIAVGGTLESAAADGAGHVYVAVEDKSQVAVIDSRERTVVARYELADCSEPSGLALDPAKGLLVVACANEKALVLRAADGTVVASPAIGKRPDAAVFDAARGVFFIPCGAGELSVIGDRETTPSALPPVPTLPGARTGALDSKTGRIYLPTADLLPAEPGQRPARVPGTFRILVVGEKG